MTAEAEEDPAATVRRTGWRLTGVDPEGAGLRRGPRPARLRSRQPVLDPESARAELVRLARPGAQPAAHG
jgi:hypothetical protein